LAGVLTAVQESLRAGEREAECDRLVMALLKRIGGLEQGEAGAPSDCDDAAPARRSGAERGLTWGPFSLHPGMADMIHLF